MKQLLPLDIQWLSTTPAVRSGIQRIGFEHNALASEILIHCCLTTTLMMDVRRKVTENTDLAFQETALHALFFSTDPFIVKTLL